MSLDEQLHELLTQLGVVLEDPNEQRTAPEARATRERHERFTYGVHEADPTAPNDRAAQGGESVYETEDDEAAEIEAIADISLFQTSREHYGVFYRLDLVDNLPQLRIFAPEDEGPLKMRCYLVRAAPATPLREWFLTSRAHQGSQAYEDARDAAHQHLLFAAGELMKRLFWTGEIDTMRFPPEITVTLLA